MKWPEAAQRYLQTMSSNVSEKSANLVARALEFKNQGGEYGDGEDGRKVNFYRSLTAAEREAFTAVADKRSFPGGARLMSEGESANHVIVILGGWTQITVRQRGGERVVAERGPGQLLGERAALRSNVRSATVTALSPVTALVMRTEDFTSFISAHPRVLAVVEDQIYGRLTEDPKGYGLDSWTATVPAPFAARPLVGPRRSAQDLDGENCTILLTDVVGFGALRRSDRDRKLIRQEHMAMLQRALAALWDSCVWEDRGDGLLIVIPPQVRTWEVIQYVHRELPPGLRRHNRTYAEPACFQLRVAVNVGPVTGDEIGMTGDAIIKTSRLVEAAALKEAMSATRCSLGIIVSEFVYDTAVGQSDDIIDIGEYRRVGVQNKEFDSRAWIWLTGAPSQASPTLISTTAGLRAAGECYSLTSLARRADAQVRTLLSISTENGEAYLTGPAPGNMISLGPRS